MSVHKERMLPVIVIPYGIILLRRNSERINDMEKNDTRGTVSNDIFCVIN